MSISLISRLFLVSFLLVNLTDCFSQNKGIKINAIIRKNIICDSIKSVELAINIENTSMNNYYLFRNTNINIKIFKVQKGNKYKNWTNQWKANELFTKQFQYNGCEIISDNKENEEFIKNYLIAKYPTNFCVDFLKLDNQLILKKDKPLILSENINSLPKLKKKEKYLITVSLLGNSFPNKDCQEIFTTVQGYKFINISSKTSLYYSVRE
ncbi:MAG: hypothetical protein MUF58_02980 [Arcicella sp.]|jgi:hypothetical protein|nr:hypothetical protein [Arcicella sp.]